MPLHHDHIFGFVVRRLREMYGGGATAEAMMAYLMNELPAIPSTPLAT